MRIVRGLQGQVSMRTEVIVRFDYGSIVPWVSQQDDGRLLFIAGPDKLLLDTTVQTHGEDLRTVGDFTVSEGEEASFVLNWSPSFRTAPPPLSGEELADACKQVDSFWTGWAAAFKPPEPWGDAVLRSLLTLKALAHWETGGIVAAGTTSLPEQLGGPRNWDYRYCWLRDATFTLYALIGAGILDEAKAWHEWLLRAVAGAPDDLQILYGVAGERRLEEYEIPWLPGYEGATPVRNRQRGGQAASARRLWRSARRVLRRAPRRSLHQRCDLGVGMRASFRTSRKSGESPTRASGKCAAARATSRTRR